LATLTEVPSAAVRAPSGGRAALMALHGIHKRFGGIHALRGVDFSVEAGQVHALVGENGAGKSTMMKIIAGNYPPDAGTMRMGDEAICLATPQDAIRRGIALIHQETALAPDLSVAENVFLCQLPWFLRRADIHRRAARLIEGLGFHIAPGQPVAQLSAAQRQVVEIAKALSLNAKLLVLDEPTALLSPADARRLLDIVRGLQKRGVGVVYISHRLDEVFDIADRITVLKDGQTAGTVKPSDVNIDGLIKLMVGRPLAAMFPPRRGEHRVTPGAVKLRVTGMTRPGQTQGASFEVRAGEVLGIGGLIGSGRTELVRLIFGADARASGRVEIDGIDVTPQNTRQAVAAGIGLVPEDRKTQGVILSMSIQINSTLANLRAVSHRLGLIKRRHERATVSALCARLGVKARSIDADVSSLSGGNQQKVVLAKWFHAQGQVLIFDEPTRGVDVGAKAEIYTLVNALAAEGKAIVLVSCDHQELIGMCDRIMVMGDGRIRGYLAPAQYSEENIVAMSLGLMPPGQAPGSAGA